MCVATAKILALFFRLIVRYEIDFLSYISQFITALESVEATENVQIGEKVWAFVELRGIAKCFLTFFWIRLDCESKLKRQIEKPS